MPLPIELEKIRVALGAKKKELEKAFSSQGMMENIAKGAGETALKMFLSQAQDNSPEPAAPDTTALAQGAAAGMENKAPKKELSTTETSSKDMSSPKGSVLKSLMKSGVELGRGLIEGALGMPESVPGSSSSIPYTVGKLPGDLVRTKVGLPTSTQSTVTRHSLQPAVGELTPEAYTQLSDEVARAPIVIKKLMSDPKLMAQYGIKDEEGAKRVIMQRLIDKYGVNYTSKIKSALGIKSGLDEFATALAGLS